MGGLGSPRRLTQMMSMVWALVSLVFLEVLVECDAHSPFSSFPNTYFLSKCLMKATCLSRSFYLVLFSF